MIKKSVFMNAALIFAGGTGTRMNIKTMPKQFLPLHKPIILYTLGSSSITRTSTPSSSSASPAGSTT